MEKRVTEVEDKVSNIAQVSEERVVEIVKSEVSKHITSSPKQTSMDIKRRCNLVVRNLEETARETDEVLFRKVQDIVGEVCKVGRLRKVVDTFRLGKKIEGRRRPVKVVLSCERVASNCISSAKSLKNSKRFSRVYIGPDLSREERLIESKLLADRMEAKKSGRDVVIWKPWNGKKGIFDRAEVQRRLSQGRREPGDSLSLQA